MKLSFRAGTTCCRIALLMAVCTALPLVAQPDNAAADNAGMSSSLAELQSQIRELKDLVLQLQAQSEASRAEIKRLRQDLESTQERSSSAPASDLLSGQHETASTHSVAELQDQITQLQEDQQLLTGKIDEQYQTKLESASKYRVRFSGIALVNLFANRGAVNNQDVPYLAVDNPLSGASSSVGGTLRQSILGFEVFGPELWGARTSGSINMDFGGGFPSVSNGVNSGLFRLRTATVRLDWKNTSVIAGQDQLFFVPESPTSYASLIVPALSYAGNLWAWTPQIRVEHRFAMTERDNLSVQAGVLDPLTGEPPAPYYTWYRYPDAGERAHQPAFAGRVAYSRAALGHTFSVGAGGYYSRENWGYDRMVNGWAATLDWNVPLGRWFTVNGAVYRGSAIGGLGAGIGRSVLFDGPLTNPYTMVEPLNTVGGWAQLKYRPTSRLEFNVAFGQDNPFASDVRLFADKAQSYGDPTLTRNRGAFGNVIYRPRSDLLLSLEYRRLRTFSIYDDSDEANQVNLMMGILF